MNKKFLSAILFGAMMAASTGTFVSCKDYDDDIDELWDAVKNQKSDLESKVTAVESTVAGLQSAQTGLQTQIEAAKAAAEEAKTAAEKAVAEAKDAAEKAAAESKGAAEKAAAEAKVAALEAQEAAIAAAAKDLAAVKAELQAAIASASAEDQKAAEEALKAATEKIEAEMAEIVGSIASIEKAYQSADAAILKELDAAKAAAAKAQETADKAQSAAEKAAAEATKAIAEAKAAALEAQAQASAKAAKDLADAEAALTSQITELNKKVTANATEIGKLKAALEAQQVALTNYAQKADVEVNTAAIKAIQDKLKGYEELLNTLNAFDVEETEKAIATLTEQMTQTSENITKIQNDLDILSAAFAKGVTHVSLIATSSNGEVNDLTLNYATATKTWVFGEKLPGAISFEKGKGVQQEASFVIRVSPSDARITAENITLINSKGGDLAGLVKVKDVKPYDKLLSRGVSANGLWEVTVALENGYDADAYKAATKTKVEEVEKSVLYAVSLNTTVSDNEETGKTYSRSVVSEYDLTFDSENLKTSDALNFKVDGKTVSEIANRYDVKEDLKWKDGAKDEIETKDGDSQNAIKDNDDDRSELTAIPVVLNQPFTVKIEDSNVAGFYVAIDYDRSGESDSSEKVAWKKYESKIKGLNTVTKEGEIDITITDEDALTDYICFRVYAVNHNGQLVDPDGKAFEVVVGEASEELSAYNVVKTWTANGQSYIKPVRVAEGVFGEWTEKVETVEVIAADTVKYGDAVKDQAFTVKYQNAENQNLNGVTNLSDVEFITVETAVGADDYWYDDFKTYSVTLAFKNERGQVLKTMKVNYKKELPSFPGKFQAKVNQLTADGTLNAFMLPAPENSIIKGTKDLAQSFNGLDDENFVFTFANAARDTEDELTNKVVNFVDNVGYKLDVANEFIDNKTKHAATVSYNFGKISSKSTDKNGQIADYIVFGDEFKNIIFSCLAEINKYDWVKAPALTYAQEDGKTLLSNIKSTNERDGKYTTTLDKLLEESKDKMINLESAICELHSQVAKDGAIKEGSMNEYFIPEIVNNVTIGEGEDAESGMGITFTPNSQAQNPESTVYSTLIIKAKDYFDHPVVITIKNVEVKKR